MSRRHLLEIEDLADDSIEALIARAVELAGGARPRACRGEVASLFCEASTRTRVSFELAAQRLGLSVVRIDPALSSSTKGESLADTGRTLAAMGIDAIVVRHTADGEPGRLAADLADWPVAVINAGDGVRGHPTQALLDAAALREAGIDVADRTITIVGDIRHSRVARSSLALYRRLGAGRLRVAGPPGLLPDEDELAGIDRFDDLDAALDGADVVVCLRIQRERIRSRDYPDGEAYHAAWGLTRQRAAHLASHARILHPGPVNRGVEIDSDVADSTQSLILAQVRMGVYLRTAVFEWLIRQV